MLQAAIETVPRAHGRLLIISGQMGPGQELRRNLERRGFDVRLALTSLEALDRARNWHPSVVLVDLELDDPPGPPPGGPEEDPDLPDRGPRQNGRPERAAFALCQRLRSSHDSRALPVIFLATEEQAESADAWLSEALLAGGSDFLSWKASPVVMQARIFQSVKLHEIEGRLRLKSIRDELTGLYSGQFLVEHLRQLLHAVLTPEARGSLAFCRMDLDRFPELTRNLPALELESLLVMTGELLRENSRGDLVARIAPDKYAVLLSGVEEEEVLRRAEATRLAVERETAVEFPATVSLGVACFSLSDLAARGGVDPVINLLHKHASLGVQQAQGYGGNQVSVYAEREGGERRRDTRWEVTVRVELLGRYGVREARSASDLSNGGVALGGVSDLKIGDHVELLIHLGEEVVSATGVVAWCGQVVGGAQRCGIAFESLAGDGQEVLRQFLADRARELAESQEEAAEETHGN